MSCIAIAIPIGALLVQRSKVLAASLPAEIPFTDNPIIGASFWIGRLTAQQEARHTRRGRRARRLERGL